MGTIQFTIPKPCHEDWNLMSPEEKGRFCGKCCKTVMDFSNKSTTEIQKFIQEHEHEKLCGRFRNDQLKRPVQIDISYRSLVNRLNYSQSFFVSLLIVFGTTFFSCTTHNNDVVGEINLTNSIVNDTIGTDSIVCVTTGEIVSEMVFNVDNIKSISKGEIESIRTEDNFPDTNIDLPAVDIVAELCSLRDGFAVGCYSVYLSRAEEASVETIQADDSIESVGTDEYSGQAIESSIVYPNPTSGIVNLKFNITADKMVGVELYDLNGKLIRILKQSQLLTEGENDIQMDLSGLPPSTYLLRLIKDDQVESKRIVILY